jgi:hypothetical protein
MMKRLCVLAAIVMIAAPALASPDILPVAGIAGTWRYDYQTGERTPDTRLRHGQSLWAATQLSGWFLSIDINDVYLDWGDIASPVAIGAFGFAYCTNADAGVTAVIAFYDNDNGWNGLGTPSRECVAAFEITDLPGAITPPPP